MSLAEPRFEDRASFLIAGTHVVYTWSTAGEIPLQWQRFATIMDTIPGRIGTKEYGVNVDARKEGFDYLCGIEVQSSANLDRSLVCVTMPAQRYVVFTHDAPLDTLRSTYLAIWNAWFPSSGYTATQAPNFEQYGADFDPETGSGPVEIWIGVVPR
jgi:AraC family transcriptional regulator